jgi:osmotically-inducible protein OsmY
MSSLNPIFDRAMGIARRTSRRGARLGRRLASDAIGLVRRAQSARSGPKPGMDDVTLTRKVETELFRAADAPKGTVNVNVVAGVVELRGQVKHPEDIRALEAKARGIPEVRGVNNLLHLPKTPSPTRTDSPESHRRRATTGPRSDAS